MARHIYRYRSLIDECPCSTDGQPSYANVSRTVPVFYGRSAPVYPVSYPIYQQTVVMPNQHYPIPQQTVNSQQYCYDNHGNMIPLAVAVPV